MKTKKQYQDKLFTCDWKLLLGLEEWEQIVSENESEFIAVFCPYAWTLLNVTWDSENMRFVYVLDNGQHVVDSVHIDKWLSFLETCRRDV